jgi:hypothetical protein
MFAKPAEPLSLSLQGRRKGEGLKLPINHGTSIHEAASLLDPLRCINDLQITARTNSGSVTS